MLLSFFLNVTVDCRRKAFCSLNHSPLPLSKIPKCWKPARFVLPPTSCTCFEHLTSKVVRVADLAFGAETHNPFFSWKLFGTFPTLKCPSNKESSTGKAMIDTSTDPRDDPLWSHQSTSLTTLARLTTGAKFRCQSCLESRNLRKTNSPKGNRYGSSRESAPRPTWSSEERNHASGSHKLKGQSHKRRKHPFLITFKRNAVLKETFPGLEKET